MRTQYYTNEDIEVIIDELENETENSMKNALKSILVLLKEIRDNKNSKVYTQPTGNKKDIVVGKKDNWTDGDMP